MSETNGKGNVYIEKADRTRQLLEELSVTAIKSRLAVVRGPVHGPRNVLENTATLSNKAHLASKLQESWNLTIWVS